jgi:hypothetical protein
MGAAKNLFSAIKIYFGDSAKSSTEFCQYLFGSANHRLPLHPISAKSLQALPSLLYRFHLAQSSCSFGNCHQVRQDLFGAIKSTSRFLQGLPRVHYYLGRFCKSSTASSSISAKSSVSSAKPSSSSAAQSSASSSQLSSGA